MFARMQAPRRPPLPPPAHQEQSALLQRCGELRGPAVVHETLRSAGQPLDASTRAVMEARFGHDLSLVRIHGDARASEAAKAVGAQAFTVGPEIVLGAGALATQTGGGSRLLAHELIARQQAGTDRRTYLRDLPTAREPSATQLQTTEGPPRMPAHLARAPAR